MKPNTLAMGFYSNDLPVDTLENLAKKLYKRSKAVRYIIRDQSLEKYERVISELPELRTTVSPFADQGVGFEQPHPGQKSRLFLLLHIHGEYTFIFSIAD